MPNYLRLIPFALAFAAGAAFAGDVRQTALSADHPLLGTWRIDLPHGCFEEYTFRSDGTKLSWSGPERDESVFEISERPSSKGFYRWMDKITKANGKPDCAGEITPLGDIAENFILFRPGGKTILLCTAESTNSCYAEFYRAGQGI